MGSRETRERWGRDERRDGEKGGERDRERRLVLGVIHSAELMLTNSG